MNDNVRGCDSPVWHASKTAELESPGMPARLREVLDQLLNTAQTARVPLYPEVVLGLELALKFGLEYTPATSEDRDRYAADLMVLSSWALEMAHAVTDAA